MSPRLFICACLLWLCSVECTTAAPPAAPAAFKATAIAYNYIGFSWVDSSVDEVGFEMEYSTGGGFTVLGTVAPANATKFSLTGTPANVTFTFRIRAFNFAADGTTRVYSSYVTAAAITTPGTAVKFDAPTGLTAVTTATTIALSWTDNATVESGYAVSIKEPALPFFYTLGTYTGSGTGTLGGFIPATVYGFQLVAFVTIPGAGAGVMDTFVTVAPNPSLNTSTKDIITSPAALAGNPGGPCSFTFTNTTASAVTTRTLTGYPASLSFNASTGLLSGNFPGVGNYPLSYQVSFANGWIQSQTFTLRIWPAESTPTVATLLPDWNAPAGTTRDTPLAGAFTDTAESAVRLTTTKGSIDLILYNTATPLTVANFMNYLNRGDYHGIVIHRAPQNFVVQGGAFRSTGSGSAFTTPNLVLDPPVLNEPGISNVRGTLSMAKISGQPNSATNQFFINQKSNATDLDVTNGGFTVFGRVALPGLPIVDAINALPKASYPVTINGNPGSFTDLPIDAPVAPPVLDPAQLVTILTATSIPTLTYSITGNTHPEVAAATINSGQLHLTGLASGETTVAITATNLDQHPVTQTLHIQLTDTYATWSARQTFPGGQSASNLNPDGDTLNNFLEYALLTNPALPQTPDPIALGRTPGGHLTLTFPHRKYTPALTYTIQSAPSPTGPWTSLWSTPNGFNVPQVLTTTDLPTHTLVTIEDPQPITPNGSHFLRLKVSE